MSIETSPTLREAVREQFQSLYDVHAILELTDRSLDTFSGDENSLTIVSDLSSVSSALRVAKKLLLEIQETLEVAASQDEKQAQVKS